MCNNDQFYNTLVNCEVIVTRELKCEFIHIDNSSLSWDVVLPNEL